MMRSVNQEEDELTNLILKSGSLLCFWATIETSTLLKQNYKIEIPLSFTTYLH